MVSSILFLESASLFGGDGFGSVLDGLQKAGFFSYIIPFLLIFALVFGILSRMQLFKENRAVTSIIALAVGLMALQLDIVPKFFSAIFPRFGVAISIILVLLIVIGLFLDPKKPWLMYVLLGVAAVIVVIVLVQTSGSLGLPIGEWLQQNVGTALLILVIGGLIIGAVIAVIASGKQRNVEEYNPFLVRIPTDGKS